MRRTKAAAVVGVLGGALALGVVPGGTAAAAPIPGDAPAYRAASALSTTAAAAAASAKKRKVQRHKVHLVLVKGPRGKDKTTLADLKTAVRQVNAFYVRSTGGRIKFKVGKTHNWVRGRGYCNNSIAGTLADRFGWKPKKNVHVVAYQAVGCAFAGQGSWPGKLVLLAQGSSSNALAHELGHNLGLGHANSSRCSKSLAKACSVKKDARRATEYGDLTDVMGAELGDSSRAFDPTPIAGTFNPAMLRTLRAPVHATTIDLARLKAPRSVVLTSRAKGGYTTVALPWAGRTVWLSYQPPRADDGSMMGMTGYYRPATTPQVVMHARGPQSSSVLIPRTGAPDDGAGLPVPGTYSVPGGVQLQTELVGDTVRVTFTP